MYYYYKESAVAVALTSVALLMSYTYYTLRFSLRRSMFKSRRAIWHNLPGNLMALTGTLGYLWLGLDLLSSSSPQSQQQPPSWTQHRTLWNALFGTWLVSFGVNTLTGFFMIPLLPNVDPAAKREFISLILVQLSFVPVVWGTTTTGSSMSAIQMVTWIITGWGLLTSVANLVLYVMDFSEGKSAKVVSGQYLYEQMQKQERERQQASHKTAAGSNQNNNNNNNNNTTAQPTTSFWFHDYIAVCFQRGSETTRMPANGVMIFIAISLVFPLLLFANLARHYPAIQAAYLLSSTNDGNDDHLPPKMQTAGLFSLLVLGTVGNMQVFHGTVSVRGMDTVRRASWMVAVTVVLELIVMYCAYVQVLGVSGFAQYLNCTSTGQCARPDFL